MRPKIIYYYISLLIFLTQIAGCASYQKQKELEKVAKDWCLTIRASQVIPVYPLTEDLEPGDIFLVQTPIPKQAEEYKKRGFLPLDQHMTRISKLDYQTFYKEFYGINTHTDTPHHWQRLYLAPDANSDPNIHDPNRHLLPTHWHQAPRAAFPSYTFTVNSTVGFQAALPIKGIPVGLSMIQAEKATGSVTISDAYTYGVAFDELVDKVNTWAQRPQNKAMLTSIREGVLDAEPWLDPITRFVFRPIFGKSERTIYLRVVNRVYLAGRVDVSLRNTTSGNVWGKGGWFQKSADPNSAEPNDVNNLITGYNKVIKVSDPKTDIGGKFNVIWATNRSVSLSEAFDRPLVIGYLGFDFPVMGDGSLGAPVATLNQIGGIVPPVAKPITKTKATSRTALISSLHLIQRSLYNSEDNKACYLAKNMDSVESLVPDTYGFIQFSFVPIDSEPNALSKDKLRIDGYSTSRTPINVTGLKKANSYWGQLYKSGNDLNRALSTQNMPFRYDGNDINCSDSETLNYLRKQRDEIKKMHEDFTHRLISHPDIVTAVNYLPELLE